MGKPFTKVLSVNVKLSQMTYIIVRNYGYTAAKSALVLIKPIQLCASKFTLL